MHGYYNSKYSINVGYVTMNLSTKVCGVWLSSTARLSMVVQNRRWINIYFCFFFAINFCTFSKTDMVSTERSRLNHLYVHVEFNQSEVTFDAFVAYGKTFNLALHDIMQLWFALHRHDICFIWISRVYEWMMKSNISHRW